MFSAIYLICFLLGGYYIIQNLQPQLKPITRIWLGAALGLLFMMWLPVIFAFIYKFSLKAHIFALATLLLLCVGSYFIRSKENLAAFDNDEKENLRNILIFILPIILLTGYLQFTHNIRISNTGALHSGQSTYGDLPLHLSIITSIPNSSFPPDYSIYYGGLLSYPFLIDSLSSSLYIFGFSLQLSIILPGTLICSIIYIAYYSIVRECTKYKSAAILAFLLLFLNGGLGFLYTLDGAGTSLFDKLREVFNGFYMTPTNQPMPNNLRWSNIIADMLIPQRTFMGGWLLVMPIVYFLVVPFYKKTSPSKRQTLLMIIFTAALPMVNTHAFLAIGLFAIGELLFQTIYQEKELRVKHATNLVFFGAIALILAIPQLLTWTFNQALGSNNFIKFQFNWVNNPSGRGMRDLYFWFYLKNIGLPALMILFSLFTKDKKHRAIIYGAFVIFIVAELIRFQPNEYDNNKLFYVWFLLCLPVACDWVLGVYKRLKGVGGRRLIAAVFLFFSFTSATLTLIREVISDYQLFDSEAVAASEFINENIPKHSMFLTSTTHVNPVASLSGQNILCGPDLWLYYHGFDTSERKQELYNFYSNPSKDSEILSKYGVEYIYLSPYERSEFDVNEIALSENFKEIYSNGIGGIKIYKVE